MSIRYESNNNSFSKCIYIICQCLDMQMSENDVCIIILLIFLCVLKRRDFVV